MEHRDKTNDDLMDELLKMRQRVVELEKLGIERQRIEEVLCESEGLLSDIVTRAPIMMFALDREGLYIYSGGRGLDVLGLRPDEFIGRSIYEVYADEPQILENVHRAFAGEEFSAITELGGLVWETWFSPLRDNNGEIIGVIGIATDITTHKQVEEALRASEEKYRNIFENVPISIILSDEKGQIIDINPWHVNSIGKGRTTRADYLGKNVITHPSVVNAGLSEIYRKLHAEGESFDIKEVYFPSTTGGVPGYFNVKGVPLFKDGKISGAITIHEDITERVKIQEAYRKAQERFSGIYNSSKDAMGYVNMEGVLLDVNDAFTTLTGYSKEELLSGKKYQDITAPEYHAFEAQKVAELLKTGKPIEYEKEYIRKDGSRVPIHLTVFIVKGLDGKPIGLAGIIKDITERKQMEGEWKHLNNDLIKSNKKLKQLALRDPHTGLFNHRYLTEVIEAEFYRARRYVHSLSLIMLDIDYFKSINDVYGHNFGDLVLKQLAALLKKMVRRYDVIVRFGGEEFVIVSPATDRPQALSLAQRILDVITLYNFGNKKNTVKLKLSMAVASYPEDKVLKGIDLIECAERILSKVKELGGNRVYSSQDLIKKKQRILIMEKAKEGAGVKPLREKIDRLTKRANQSLMEAVFAFAKTIELKDHYSGEHVERTVRYATEISQVLKLSEEEIERVRTAAILHDLGKIGISEKILLKKSKLTKREFEEIKNHPRIGVDIIRPIQFLHSIIPLILYHHEWWNGKGYPHGLKGEDIPVGARIIALADVYQALTSDRPYRKAFSEAKAIEIIKKNCGTQFDPQVVSAFLEILQKKKSRKK